MAKAEKMTRGVSSKGQHDKQQECLPEGVHSYDAHGNIFASFPQISRTVPRYYTIEHLRECLEYYKGPLLFTPEILDEIEKMIESKIKSNE